MCAPSTRRPTTHSVGPRRSPPRARAQQPGSSVPFAGFPAAALDFYDDLEIDNTKTFWDAHKGVYLSAVRAPMIALVEALEPEFGPAKLYRPYRQARYGAARKPYKTHQGAFVAMAPETGWYAEISAAGFRVAGGFYDATPAGLASVRAAIDGPDGAVLESLVAALRRSGFEIRGHRLKTAPRGYRLDHSRIELLRHRSLTATRVYGFQSLIHTPELLDGVRRDWHSLRPLVEWLAPRLAGTA